MYSIIFGIFISLPYVLSIYLWLKLEEMKKLANSMKKERDIAIENHNNVIMVKDSIIRQKDDMLTDFKNQLKKRETLNDNIKNKLLAIVKEL